MTNSGVFYHVILSCLLKQFSVSPLALACFAHPDIILHHTTQKGHLKNLPRQKSGMHWSVRIHASQHACSLEILNSPSVHVRTVTHRHPIYKTMTYRAIL